jgi:hypothetical protein
MKPNEFFQETFEGLSQYRIPYSRELEGKYYEIIFDNGTELDLNFFARDKVTVIENGETAVETYHCLKAEDTVYFVLIDRKKRHPRSGLLIIIDVATDLVTCNFAYQKDRPGKPSITVPNVQFGAIKHDGKPLPEERHCFTEDLIGRKIKWQYNPLFKIIHVYHAPDHYFCTVDEETREVFRKLAIEAGQEPRVPKLIYEQAFYCKIRKNIYVFSWIEKGSGTEGFIVMNTERLIDVGCFFGNNPQGDPEGYMFSAYGEWVNEHLPEEDMEPDDRYDI